MRKDATSARLVHCTPFLISNRQLLQFSLYRGTYARASTSRCDTFLRSTKPSFPKAASNAADHLALSLVQTNDRGRVSEMKGTAFAALALIERRSWRCGTSAAAPRYIPMPDFPFDPESRIRASSPIVLARTTEAIEFIRKTTLSSPNRAWEEVLQSLEAARDEWTAMEAVVHLELLLEARNMLIEESRPHASGFGQGQSRAA